MKEIPVKIGIFTALPTANVKMFFNLPLIITSDTPHSKNETRYLQSDEPMQVVGFSSL